MTIKTLALAAVVLLAPACGEGGKNAAALSAMPALTDVTAVNTGHNGHGGPGGHTGQGGGQGASGGQSGGTSTPAPGPGRPGIPYPKYTDSCFAKGVSGVPVAADGMSPELAVQAALTACESYTTQCKIIGCGKLN